MDTIAPISAIITENNAGITIINRMTDCGCFQPKQGVVMNKTSFSDTVDIPTVEEQVMEIQCEQLKQQHEIEKIIEHSGNTDIAVHKLIAKMDEMIKRFEGRFDAEEIEKLSTRV